MFAETPERGRGSTKRAWPCHRFEEMECRLVWGEAGGLASKDLLCCFCFRNRYLWLPECWRAGERVCS